MDLINFRGNLVKNKINVSDLEYTSNNYDNSGNLIREKIPTLTTDFCEIGAHNNSVYFVIIIESKLFTTEFFNMLVKENNVRIYGFKNFKEDLYPKKDFDLNMFMNKIKEDKYLQIQFDYINITEEKLLEEYIKMTKLFASFLAVINQFNEFNN